jgi:hypothetical protein
MSLAKIGMRAVAPPRRTASRSRAMAARMVFSRQRWLVPAVTLANDQRSRFRELSRGRRPSAKKAKTRHATDVEA